MNEQVDSQKLSSATGGGVPLTYVIALVPVASVLKSKDPASVAPSAIPLIEAKELTVLFP